MGEAASSADGIGARTGETYGAFTLPDSSEWVPHHRWDGESVAIDGRLYRPDGTHIEVDIASTSDPETVITTDGLLRAATEWTRGGVLMIEDGDNRVLVVPVAALSGAVISAALVRFYLASRQTAD